MPRDRYLRIILTVIALELGAIALKDVATPISAQQTAQRLDPIPVVVTGLTMNREGSLPVRVMGTDRPIQIEAAEPLMIEAARPIVVETADRPLMTKSVQAPQTLRPGVSLP